MSKVCFPLHQASASAHACALGDERVALAEEDQRVRAELASDRLRFEGYYPTIKAVHERNAARLARSRP